MLHSYHRNGFTLIEALVACVVLSAAVVTISGISTRCLNQTRLNMEYEQAWQALDQQLKIIDMMGIEEFIRQGVMEGDIENEGEGDNQDQSRYHWDVQTESEEIDNLYLVKLTIRWNSDNKVRSVAAMTLLNGRSISVF
ncbi:MAG: prepilin-type N-terminal cleavage/methylation domain-containing protein [Sedimentisphaerales bacterium]|nr:prepilin-type N-terminal cleavage/methylation domain-containing protein [Sedimentisphaerales bacterium]